MMRLAHDKSAFVLIDIALLFHARIVGAFYRFQIKQSFVPQQCASGALAFLDVRIFLLEVFEESSEFRFVGGHLLGEFHCLIGNNIKIHPLFYRVMPPVLKSGKMFGRSAAVFMAGTRSIILTKEYA